MSEMPHRITPAESGAFIRQIDLPPCVSGSLDGLTFAVKDLIDIAGHETGCGNPTWRQTHPPAHVHAPCVEQLLAAGARCLGKTVTDELAFSLIGENHFYGTPLNPKAPAHVPGGSSSGSASAVASGLVDFAIGTDTGGSVRVPASNCGLFGMRPSHGRISLAGVMPFAPTFDTIGLLASQAEVLARAASVLLSCHPASDPDPKTIFIVEEAFELADPEVRQALDASIMRLRTFWGPRMRTISLRLIDEEPGASALEVWHETYCVVQWGEVWSCLGSWIVEMKPEFGPAIAASFELPRTLDRRRVPPAIERRERYFRRLMAFLGPHDLLCIPTVPTPAPLKGSRLRRDANATGYYPRALSLTSLAGIGRLPEATLPIAEVNGLPVGLSLLAGHDHDAFLLGVVQAVAGRLVPMGDRSER